MTYVRVGEGRRNKDFTTNARPERGSFPAVIAQCPLLQLQFEQLRGRFVAPRPRRRGRGGLVAAAAALHLAGWIGRASP